MRDSKLLVFSGAACKYMILREKLLIKNKIELFFFSAEAFLTNLSSPVSCSCYRYVMDFLLRKILWFSVEHNENKTKNAHFSFVDIET